MLRLFEKILPSRHKKEVKRLKALSEENLQKLQDELKLVNSARADLTQNFAMRATEFGNDHVVAAMNQLKVERIVLVAKINALQNFLTS